MPELYKYISTCPIVKTIQINRIYAIIWSDEDEEYYVNRYIKYVPKDGIRSEHLSGVCITVLENSGTVFRRSTRYEITAAITPRAHQVFDLGPVNTFPFPELLF